MKIILKKRRVPKYLQRSYNKTRIICFDKPTSYDFLKLPASLGMSITQIGEDLIVLLRSAIYGEMHKFYLMFVRSNEI